MTPSIVFWQLRLRNFDECISHTQRLKFIFLLMRHEELRAQRKTASLSLEICKIQFRYFYMNWKRKKLVLCNHELEKFVYALGVRIFQSEELSDLLHDAAIFSLLNITAD